MLYEVYDIPRPQLEAVYINKGFEDERPTYDTPRSKKVDTSAFTPPEEVSGYPEEGEDAVECNYDVPKAGSRLSVLMRSMNGVF